MVVCLFFEVNLGIWICLPLFLFIENRLGLLLNVSFNIGTQLFFDPIKEFLGVTSDLSAGSCPNVILNFLPVSSKYTHCYRKRY
jgi:hypothetical protein